MAKKPVIPYIDIRKTGLPDFVARNRDKTIALIQSIKGLKGEMAAKASKPLFMMSDKISERWLRKTQNPYYNEIRQFQKDLKIQGVYTLNLSYEWGCTTSVIDTKNGPIMTRVLDWPFPSMDDSMVVLHQQGPAGDFHNVTWPGLSGVFNAVAKGRFSAAINQAPIRRSKFGTKFSDQHLGRFRFRRTNAMPPAHLLRKVMEEAKDYTEARRMLSETPIAIPVIFTLAGTKPGEGCVIERTETAAYVREMKNCRVSVSNHFQSELAQKEKWTPRRECSYPRAIAGNKIKLSDVDGKFSWFKAPIANEYSRLAMTGNARKGKINLVGTDGPAITTKVFRR